MTIINSKELDSIREVMKDSTFPWLISGGWTIDLGKNLSSLSMGVKVFLFMALFVNFVAFKTSNSN